MATYTVTGATKKKDVQGKHGPMQVITLMLEGHAPLVEWFTKADTPLPAPGSTIEGEVSQDEYGFKFKKTPAGGFAGGGGKTPEQQKSIVRQHSQEMALRYCTLKGAKPAMGELRKVIDWFQRDAEEGWKPKPALPPAPPQHASDVPNDFPAPPTAEEMGVDPKDIPF
jgi:hypothetical protein